MLRACTKSWVEVLSSSVGLVVLQAGPVLAQWGEGDLLSYISLVCSRLDPEPVATSSCRQRNAAPPAACAPSPPSPGWSGSSAAQGLKMHATEKRQNTLLAHLSEIELSIKPMFLFACKVNCMAYVNVLIRTLILFQWKQRMKTDRFLYDHFYIYV